MSRDIIDINEKKVESFIEKMRPPVELREQMDLGYSYTQGVIELFEIRPIWASENEYQNIPFAKIKFVKAQRTWKLYWKRSSGKWEAYDPLPQSSTIEELLNCIDEDAKGCFKG